jgi:hypothetical protein
MSQYNCPICSGSTSVIETRASNGRLRRRRTCPVGHRFTTIEVPHQTPKKLKELVDWLGKQGLDPDIVSYAKEELGVILFGMKSEADDEPEEGSPETPEIKDLAA